MMNTRQKCLAYFLKKSEHCSRIKLSKIFFLIGEDKSLDSFKFYGFVPYKFGPYSFELFNDVEKLENDGFLITGNNEIVYQEGDVDLSSQISNIIDHYIKETSILNDEELINFVYHKYPEYTIFSEIRKLQKYERDEKGITTIGYEGLSIDEFIMRLIDEKVQVLIDVRNNPWSMKYGFTKKSLVILCEKMGIEYLNIPEVGIPSEMRKQLKSKDDYQKLFKRYRKYIMNMTEFMDIILELGREKKTALMCFEKDPEMCHRTVLAEELERREKEVLAG